MPDIFNDRDIHKMTLDGANHRGEGQEEDVSHAPAVLGVTRFDSTRYILGDEGVSELDSSPSTTQGTFVLSGGATQRRIFSLSSLSSKDDRADSLLDSSLGISSKPPQRRGLFAGGTFEMSGRTLDLPLAETAARPSQKSVKFGVEVERGIDVHDVTLSHIPELPDRVSTVRRRTGSSEGSKR
jgi:hypothetical protein